MNAPYTKYEQLPAYTHRKPVGKDGKQEPTEHPIWTGDAAPPAIGSTVKVRINRIGTATVIGYFSEHGYFGLLVRPLNPPAWYIKQNGRRGICHVFGVEIDAPSPEYTIVIPYVAPSDGATEWHPTDAEGAFSTLTRGAFASHAEAIAWARTHLNGLPYTIKLITEEIGEEPTPVGRTIAAERADIQLGAGEDAISRDERRATERG